MTNSTQKLTIYTFLAETADRRSKKYKQLDKELDDLCNKFGKESKEIRDFFNTIIII